MRNYKNEEQELRRILKENPDALIYTKHVLERMAGRNIIDTDISHVLETGRVDLVDPVMKLRVLGRNIDGEKMCVVAIEINSKGEKLILVTAWFV